jgi:hypothetical protein
MSFAPPELANSNRLDSRPRGKAAVRRRISHSKDSRSADSDWSKQLVGDAATEIQDPLSTITESIRSVTSGELGPLSRLQHDCLTDAAAACQRIDEMIAGLRRLPQLSHGHGVVRCWFDLNTLRFDVEQALARSLPRRDLALQWHGVQPGQCQVFGDPSRVCLLLVTLLSGAIRRSPRGHRLLVRVNQALNSTAVQLSVVEHLSVAEPRTIAQYQGSFEPTDLPPMQSAVETAMCQQLAAALLTGLNRTRRNGDLGEIIFELPGAGLRSVAIQWAKWRTGYSETASEPNPRETREPLSPAASIHGEPLHNDHAAVFTVTAGAAVSPETIEVFNRRLQLDTQPFDLIYRISQRRWVVVWDASIAQARARMEQLASAELNTASPMRLHWSSISTLPICEGQTVSILTDRLARESLSDSDTSAIDVDQSQGWSDPILAPSSVASDRLALELTHLAARVSAQSELLQQQARSLRGRR